MAEADSGSDAAKQYPFQRLCQFLQAVEDLTGATGAKSKRGDDKAQRMRELFDDVAKQAKGRRESLFPFLRLIIPHEDKTRMYQMKEAELNALYVRAIAADKATEQKIVNWKQPGKSTGSLRGDMADVISHNLRERSKASAVLSVWDINAWLDKLSEAVLKEAGRAAARLSLLVPLLDKLNFSEHKWLIRIVLKEMRLGCKSERVLAAMHPGADKLFQHSAALASVCATCVDPSYRFSETDMQLFTPVLPMLSTPSTCEEAAHKLSATPFTPFVAEFKLDGERLMLHLERPVDGRPGRRVWWTRRCTDFTDHYEGAAMAALFQSALKPSVHSLIVDGEMLVWDTLTERFLPFGSNRTMNVGHRKGVSDNLQPCYCVFDLLFLNGQNVTAEPLARRKQLLAEALTPIDRRLELVVGETMDRADGPLAPRICAKLDEAMALGLEGLVLKKLSSPYVPASRTWLKLKPDYSAGYFQTLDLLIVGGYYGTATSGRHWKSNGVSHFLLGLRAPDSTPHGSSPAALHPPIFTLAKVGTGYGAKELLEMRRLLDPIAQKWPTATGGAKAASPAHLCGWRPSKVDDRPDVWYPPDRSLVVEVKAYELLQAAEGQWRAGLTLRFPRVERVRYDREPKTSATMAEVTKLFEDLQRRGVKLSFAKFGADGADGADAEPPSAKKKRKALDSKVLGGTLPLALRNGELAVKVDVFAKAEVLVLADVATEELQTMAAELNARLTVNATPATRYVVVDAELKAGKAAAERALREKGAKIELFGRAFDLISAAREWRRAAAATAAAASAATAVRSGGDGKAAAPPKAAGKAAAKKVEPLDFAQMNILTADWLVDCHAQGKLLPPEPRCALHLSASSKEALEDVMDEWGDHYSKRGSIDEMREAMALVRLDREMNGPPTADRLDVHAILRASGLPDEEVLRLDPPPGGALRHPRRCVVLMPECFVRGAPDTRDPLRGSLACEAVELQLLGARVVHEPTDAVTTVVLPVAGDEATRLVAQLRDQFDRIRAAGGLVHDVRYVRPSWVSACCREHAWAAEAEHQVHA
jgi:DNA ligase-4